MFIRSKKVLYATLLLGMSFCITPSTAVASQTKPHAKPHAKSTPKQRPVHKKTTQATKPSKASPAKTNANHTQRPPQANTAPDVAEEDEEYEATDEYEAFEAYEEDATYEEEGEADDNAVEGETDIDENDPFISILHLDLPEDVINLLLAEYEEEHFAKVELGSTFKPPMMPQIVATVLITGLCIGMVAMTIFVRWFAGMPADASIPFFYMFMTCSCLMFVALILAINNVYQQFLFPGFFFLTDVGMLVIEPGRSTDRMSTFYYKDMVCANDIFTLKEMEMKHVLRIVDKYGQVYEYESEYFDEFAYLDLCFLLKRKIAGDDNPA